MIPSAITMELKYGLLCSTGEDICTYGQFPLLASTESLLGKLGFELCEDDSTSNSLLESLIHPCETSSWEIDEDGRMERLSDVLLIALDDVRDMKHREEDSERISRRSKNFKIKTLEKSRAKMLEQQNKTDIEENAEETNSEEIHQAWVRMARTLNSARLLLFLFSHERGVDALAAPTFRGEDEEATSLRNLRKMLTKLADALEIMAMTSPLEKKPSDALSAKSKTKWEQFITTGLKMRSASREDSKKQDNKVNESIVDLTDDSSVDSDGVDDLSAKMLANAIDDENQLSTPEKSVKTPDKNPLLDRFVYWNFHLDGVMNDVIATMKKNIEIHYLEQAFLSDDSTDIEMLYDKAKLIDEQFSLIVGVRGSEEYQQRKKYLLAIEALRDTVEHRIRQGRNGNEFEDARLDVYGSCLSGLSLGKNADVDLSLTFSLGLDRKRKFEAGDMTAKKYARHVTDTVYKIKRKFESSNLFRNIEAVPRARVPVIKGVYLGANNPHSDDGSLQFDICLLNDIAVANSGLIKEYSDMDIRVKSLMIAVKKWTKDNKINSAQDNTLSSYTWINLVIFYLQCIGFVPNLQCPKLMRACNHEMGWGKSRRWQDNVNNLNTAYLKWNGQADRAWKRSKKIDQAYASVSILLYGFFRFYTHEFPIQTTMVSIKRGGNLRLPKTMFSDRASLHLCIEDPFETYDSHFPHDLGVPADEAGSMLISKCFAASEEYLREILFANGPISQSELWPIIVVQTKTQKTAAKRAARRKDRKSLATPQMTLVIGIPRRHRNQDEIRKLFQPFADKTGSRIIGFSVVKNGRLAFVDYDSVDAVDAALAEHAKSPLKLKDMELLVSQKGAVEPSNNQAPTTPKTAAQKEPTPKKAVQKEPKKEAAEEKGNKDEKNDPKNTLVVESVSGRFSEKGVAKLFRPFAERTKSELVHIHVVKNKKGLKAFVEYSSRAAVLAAVEDHDENPLFWNGKPLEIKAKVGGGSKQIKPEGTPKGGKKKQTKKQANKSKQQDSGKPIINANESIEGQL